MTAWAYETEADETVLELVKQAAGCLRAGMGNSGLNRAVMQFLAKHPKPFGEVVTAEHRPISRDHLPRISSLMADLENVEEALAPLGTRDRPCEGMMATLATAGATVTIDNDLARDILTTIRTGLRSELARMGVQA